MHFRRLFIIFAFTIPFILLPSCNNNSGKGLLIITEVPGNLTEPDFLTGQSWRLVPGSRIVSLDPDKPGSMKVLTNEFHSACFPELSYDGRKILFAGRKNETGPWQIFEMEIKSLRSMKITSSGYDCIDPVYLPSGRIAYTSKIVNDTVRSAYSLFTCGGDGSDVRQITFGPSASFATSVLKDGRLLTVNQQLIPDPGDQMLVVMRPDGTKADLFYRGAKGSRLISRARETDDGRLVFIEGKSYSENELVSITYNRPLHSMTGLPASAGGSFSSVLPLHDGRILVSYRKPGSGNYSVFEYNVEDGTVGESIYNNEYNVLDITEAKPYERPKKLPSEVDMQVRTGLLLCQDINYAGYQPGEKSSGVKASRIEIMGVDSTYGIVEVEEDGSFYMKVMADVPFQIRRIDERGNIVGDPCTWMWLRPNERRGCAGCHEDPEIVPANRIAFAVRKAPVIIPVHITEVKEKVVELE